MHEQGHLEKNILSLFIQQPHLYRVFRDTLSVYDTMFCEEPIKTLWLLLDKGFERSGIFPSLSELKVAIDHFYEDAGDLVRIAAQQMVEEVYTQPVTALTEEALKKIMIDKQFSDLVEKIQTGVQNHNDPNTILNHLSKSIKDIEVQYNTVDDIGFDPFDKNNLDDRDTLYEDLYGGEPMATGILRVDEELRGRGVRPGDLVEIMGITGGGKSLLALNIALNFVKQGGRVIYYVLDDTLAELVERLDANVTGLSMSEEKTDKQISDALSCATQDYCRGQFIFKEFDPFSTSISVVESHINRVKRECGPVQAIIVDSGDHLLHRFNVMDKLTKRDYRHVLHQVFTEISGLARRSEPKMIAIATTQSNREGYGAEVITLNNLSEALSKAWPASLFLAIHQTYEELATKEGRIIICKNRRGRNYKVCPCFIDFASVRITDNMNIQPYFLKTPGKKDKEEKKTEETRFVPALAKEIKNQRFQDNVKKTKKKESE